jgi:hypothetical protein
VQEVTRPLAALLQRVQEVMQPLAALLQRAAVR